ncbi:MAG TPA: hypothetical protein VF021_03485 [Longimicrobiales bacterium]
MKYQILLSAALITALAASTASAQTPSTKTTSQQPTKPTVQQHGTTGKVVHPARSMHMKTSKQLELKDAQPGLISQATIKLDDAVATARKSYSGSVLSERVEKRGDQLLYDFGIRGRHGVRHVLVDARLGTLVKPQAHARKRTPSKNEK